MIGAKNIYTKTFYTFLFIFSLINIGAFVLSPSSQAEENDHIEVPKTQQEILEQTPVAHSPPSSDEDIAFLFWSLSKKSPDFGKYAIQNLGQNADFEAGKKEIARMNEKLGTIEPRENYIIIQNAMNFGAAATEENKQRFYFEDLIADYYQPYEYHGLEIIVVPKDYQDFSEIVLSDQGLATFMESYDQSPFINYTMHIRSSFVSPQKVPVKGDQEAYLLSGDIAYIAFMSHTGKVIWEYKTPWYGEKIENELGKLYYRNKPIP